MLLPSRAGLEGNTDGEMATGAACCACPYTPLLHALRAAHSAKQEIPEVSTIEANSMIWVILRHLLVILQYFSADAAKFLLPVITAVKFFQQRTKVIKMHSV